MKSPGSDTGSLGERALVRRILSRLPPPPAGLIVPAGDDAAVWAPPRGALQILTTDVVVEGVHFDWRYSTAGDVGYRALAVNLSDVAAMGGTPHLALLSLVLPAGVGAARVDGLIDGLLELAAEAGVAIAGGNIAIGAGPMAVDVTVVGSARPRRVLRRSGARPGDAVFVTGSLGAAAAGLAVLRADAVDAPPEVAGTMEAAIRRYRRPEPRSRIGSLLGRTRAAAACIDLSDGFGDAVRQIAEASGVGVRIDLEALPLDPGARAWCERQGTDPLAMAAASDDYELLFTVPKRRLGRLRNVVREARGVPITRIGEVTADRSIVFGGAEGSIPLPPGHEHTG